MLNSKVMALKWRFKDDHIINRLKLEIHRVELDLIEIMAYVGDEAVKEAKLLKKKDGGFDDVSGNLRSSIGYTILRDGEVVKEGFSGNPEGIDAAIKVLQNVPRIAGLQLILVAGMDYASYLESKGFNVITAQGDMAVVDLESMFRKYVAKKIIKI